MVRNTGIPEELGRISYLFTDKTGTLTQNEMLFKKLHLPSFSFHITDTESLNDIISLTSEAYFPPQSGFPLSYPLFIDNFYINNQMKKRSTREDQRR